MFHGPRFYSILASMASLTIALLSFLHLILYVVAFYELDLIPRDLRVLLEVFLLPHEGLLDMICHGLDLRVYAIIAFVLGFISYTMLYYMVSLGLYTLVDFRYELLLLYVLGLIIPALNGLGDGSNRGLYYPVYTIPNVLLEAGFRSVLYCNISYEVIPGWLELLILFQPTFMIANIILVLTLLKVYRLYRHRTLLAPLIAATAPIAILALSLAILLLALLISPFTRDGEFNLAYRVGLLSAFLLVFHVGLVAPVYGVLLWGSLAIAFLKLARGKPL